MKEFDVTTRAKFLVQISIAMCLYALLIHFSTQNFDEFTFVSPFRIKEKKISQCIIDASKLPSTLS
jgi:hypothetical protein